MLDQEIVEAAAFGFSPDFASARSKFLSSVPHAVRYQSPLEGPGGEQLGTDIAWLGDPGAERVLVLISGVHGAEGYAGSAIQVDHAVNAERLGLEPGEAILLVHALNSHGFAWGRRVTEEGCDLNRNFVDFDQGLPRNEGYRAIAPHLLPKSRDTHSLARAERALAEFRDQNGERAFQIARKGGQYEDPYGTFYGGVEPTRARRVLEKIVRDTDLARRRFVTIVDVHTGLGPYGYGEAQSEAAVDSRSHALAEAFFGHSVTSVEGGSSYSVPVTGTLQSYWERLFADGRYVYLCLEYGTFDQESSRLAYRDDHWWHAYGDAEKDSTEGDRVRQALRRVFYPESPDWNQMVLSRARQIVRQALEGMRAAA